MTSWLVSPHRVALVLALSLGSACDDACTEIAIASVTVDVVDAESGEPIVDATVEFTLDGGETRSPNSADGGSYVLAYEEAGTFEVDIGADGYETVMRTYVIELDDEGCHVEGEAETIELAIAEAE